MRRAVPAAWRRVLHGWPGLHSDDLVRLAIETAQGGARPGTWPSVAIMVNAGYDTGHATVHPHDDGVLVGGSDAVLRGGYDAVVSLLPDGHRRPRFEHVEFWFIDDGPGANPHLEFVLDDAARTIQLSAVGGQDRASALRRGQQLVPRRGGPLLAAAGSGSAGRLDAMRWSHPDPACGRQRSGRGEPERRLRSARFEDRPDTVVGTGCVRRLPYCRFVERKGT